LLPAEWAAVEILETIEPDMEVIAACEKLKQAGYLLVLDDFEYREQYKPLMDLADIVKVDVLTTSEEQRENLARWLMPLGIHLLAEKVETWEIFQQTCQMGYTYFQGYFFRKPAVLSTKDIPGFKLHYLQILQEIHRPELNFGQLEETIKQEISLSYKLLRYINSVFFGLRRQVDSIKQALVLLGEQQIKKWFSLVLLTSMGEDKPEELIVQTVIRAKLLESLAPRVGLSGRVDDLFLMGLFSLIDAIMDQPLPDVLRQIPISGDVKMALLGERNRLREVYEYILAYESGDWGKVSEQGLQLGIEEAESAGLYLEAVEWGRQCFSRESSP
jgi:EAL and modified HD-GYP domain-containing signal transduction protein